MKPKLIQVNEDFWCNPDEIRCVEIMRLSSALEVPRAYAHVYLKPATGMNTGVGFGKCLSAMWGATADEQAANFAKALE